MSLAESLAAARLSGTLASSPGSLTLAEGYTVAAALYPLLCTPAGWKVGATSAGAQAFLKVDAPIRGRLHAERIWGPGEVATPGDRPLEVEPEIVLRVGRDGAPDAAWFGIELNRPSFAEPFAQGTGAIVADNAASVGLLLGPALPVDALDAPGALLAAIFADGVEVARGSGDAVLGDPRRSFEWLRGEVELVPGELVATGAMGRSALAVRGTVLRLACGRWGEARFALI